MSPVLSTALAAVLCGPVDAPPIPAPAPLAAPATDTLEVRLYEEGAPFADFLEATRRRRDTWHGNYERADSYGDLLERVRVVPGTWRLLVVAVDACGDSANTIPYLARFVEAAGGVEMRVVEPDAGRALMDAHPTPDGRGATPTVIVLDEAGRDVGCWVERPAGIQSWWLTNPDDLPTSGKLERKYDWYDADAGYHTILEVVEAIEAAARGERICGRPVDASGVFPAAGPGGR